ncbi:class I SAM-dependent methyltransferase [Candidatus Venteria ishoeyi]|uniref:class I SAM-dependent methyltransferase n=1 Tax=Candidatus Venteria ishoeyi TaxID=1899563 RepID=UPI0025A4E7B4|nr:class I SAM-dependent methyltransferase [Candidatus Venteria ishoeyi]MDM8546567.1 class I SAM-dependent methyltransferase [Candidatus Venteria ishoeyi]
MKCRHCKQALEHVFLDLGFAPPSNAYLSKDTVLQPEIYYPLKLYVCDQCYLVQTQDYVQADTLFSSDYAYYSSTSTAWLQHAADYAKMITARLKLDVNSHVIEIASNDGYLLKNFVTAGIPCLGIEPTTGTAAAAEKLGIPVLKAFFGLSLGEKLAAENKQADLIIGNNVYAHVPDINDFTAGLKALLKPGGTITLEFPHLMRLIEQNQFDTVYHEHFSYLSLTTVSSIFKAVGLRIYDVEELPTHGGSLRIYASHIDAVHTETKAVADLLANEVQHGLQQIETYLNFQNSADKVKNNLLLFLLEQKQQGKTIVAYGAAAKGNTLLNYAGIKPDLLPVVLDAALSKQGKFLPGSHIPIQSPEVLKQHQPDWVLILPWNIKQEVMTQLAFIHEWGGQFVIAVPEINWYQT